MADERTEFGLTDEQKDECMIDRQIDEETNHGKHFAQAKEPKATQTLSTSRYDS